MFNSDNAATIFNQLTMSNNGTGRLKSMVGAKNFAYDGENSCVTFRFTAKAKNKANYCKITLNGSDLYDVEFGYVRGMDYTVRSTTENMYNDMLKEHFESETGLYLSL